MTNIKTSPDNDITKEYLNEFKELVFDEKVKPSIALRKIMSKYNCPNPHPTSVVHLLNDTYPNIDIGHNGLRFRIVDSAYPNSDPNQFSDEDLDAGIAELLEHPTGGW